MTRTRTSQSDAGDPPSTGGAGAEARPPAASDLPDALILAAGQGTRMASRRPKVLHPLAGKPLISRVLELVAGVGARRVVVVLGHQAAEVRAALPAGVETVVQEPRLGTGHAVRVAAPLLRREPAERLLVHLGDNALVRRQSLQALAGQPLGPGAPIALLTARVREPRGYGRVVRAGDGTVDGMVEELEATAEQRAVNEIWGGSMLLWSAWLWDRLPRLPRRSKGEYYLTDLVNLARQEGRRVHAVAAQDEEELQGVNDRAQLAQANAILRRRVIDGLLRAGVTILDPATTYVEPEVEIAPDVVVHPGCHLRGRTSIAADCEIGPNAELVDTRVDEGCRVRWSVLEGARVGRGVRIGPFSHLRAGAVIEDGAHLGNFAEVKGSRIGAGTQMHHFSYVGDADVGERANIGAGTVTVNFSSETRAKSQTVVEDDASVGSGTMLVAPVRLGARAITGAGAVVTRDVPPAEVWAGVPARRVRARREGGGDGR